MKKVIRYVASDNSEFNCEADAKRHDLELSLGNQLKDILKDSLTTMRVESVIKQIIVEREKIAAVIRLHDKRLPRNKKIVVKTNTPDQSHYYGK